jgi:hypothetical protein
MADKVGSDLEGWRLAVFRDSILAAGSIDRRVNVRTGHFPTTGQTCLAVNVFCFGSHRCSAQGLTQFLFRLAYWFAQIRSPRSGVSPPVTKFIPLRCKIACNKLSQQFHLNCV